MISIKEINYDHLKVYIEGLERYNTPANVIEIDRIHKNFDASAHDSFIFLHFEGKIEELKKEVEHISLSCVKNDFLIVISGNHEISLYEISEMVDIAKKCLPFKKVSTYVEWIYNEKLEGLNADVVVTKKGKL